MSCNYCGKIHLNKPCPSGYTTTTTTEDPVLCPPKPLCEELFNSHCIYYSGPDIDCAGISFGDNVNTIINNFIQELQFCCLPTTTTTTTTIDCTDPGGGGTPVFTTTTTCKPLFLICCLSAQSTQLQIIQIPCNQQGYDRKEIYQDITNGTGANSYVWVVADLSDIQSLGYSGANISYIPDWTKVLWASAGGATVSQSLSLCRNVSQPSSKCPEPVITTTTSTSTTTTSSTTTTTTAAPTTTTTTKACQQYYLSNPSSGPLTYGYISCEGVIVSGVSLPAKTCITIFAQVGSLTFTPGIIVGFGECTTTTTSTSTTTTSSTTTTTTIEPSQLCFVIKLADLPTTTTTSTTSSTTTTSTTLSPIVGEIEVFAEQGDGTDLQVTALLTNGNVGNDIPFTGFVQRYTDTLCTSPLGSPIPFSFTLFTAATTATQSGLSSTIGVQSLKIISLVVGVTNINLNPELVNISGNDYIIYGYNDCTGL